MAQICRGRYSAIVERKSEMTNLLAAVIVMLVTTTNDVPRWKPVTCSDGDVSWLMYVDEAKSEGPTFSLDQPNSPFLKMPSAGMVKPDENEKVRIVVTKQVTRLTFDWNGKPREVVDEVVLAEKRTVLKRQETWIEEGAGK